MLTLLLACTAPDRPSPPPGVVLITWDTVSAEHLALYGGAARTPTLNALAAIGARYDQAISHFPETSFSHWTMMTGVEPALHGDIPAARDSTWTGPTTAERLAVQGYATAAFVSGVTLEAGLTGLNRGFDLYDDRGDGRAEPKRRAADTIDAALGWIGVQTGPYFAFVHLFDAHYPYEPSAGCDPGYGGDARGDAAWLAPYQGHAPPAQTLSEADLAHIVRLYECEIEAQDRETGRLIAALPAGTRVVLTADHGESFGHGYYFNHRESLDDEVLRVPLVVAVLGQTQPTVVAGQVGLAAVDVLLRGEVVEPVAEVASITDPWERQGFLSVRAVKDGKVERGIWALAEGDSRRVTRENGEVPAVLVGAQERYAARVGALWGQVQEKPARPVQDGVQERLEAIGYR